MACPASARSSRSKGSHGDADKSTGTWASVSASPFTRAMRQLLHLGHEPGRIEIRRSRRWRRDARCRDGGRRRATSAARATSSTMTGENAMLVAAWMGLPCGESFEPSLEHPDRTACRTPSSTRNIAAGSSMARDRLLRPRASARHTRSWGTSGRPPSGRAVSPSNTWLLDRNTRLRPLVGKPAHQLDRVVDIDPPREHRIVLAGPHVRDGGADEGKFVARPLERREVGIARDRERRPFVPLRREEISTANAELATMRLNGGADQAVAADDKAETAPTFLEMSAGHRRIY